MACPLPLRVLAIFAPYLVDYEERVLTDATTIFDVAALDKPVFFLLLGASGEVYRDLIGELLPCLPLQ